MDGHGFCGFEWLVAILIFVVFVGLGVNRFCFHWCQSTRGIHLWSHICDAIVKLCKTSYSRQWGGPFLSCEIDVVWILFLLGDELPHRVRPIFVLCQTVARNNSPFRPIFRWGLLGDRGERYCWRGINGKIRVRTWCLFVCEYETCFRGMWLRWFLERICLTCSFLYNAV